jgi:hypothetical protein
MFRSGLVRSLAAVIGAFLIASCSEAGITAPAAPARAVATLTSQNFGGPEHIGGEPEHIGVVPDAAHLRLRAVWWKNIHPQVFKVSKTIYPSGGTISIPQTGLTVSFPAGALAAPLRITIISDPEYVAYRMEPCGTRFLKDVAATQLLAPTNVSGVPPHQLYAAYIANDKLSLRSIVKVSEIEPSITIFSPDSRDPVTLVWVIRHFSRYMLASG